VNIVIYSDGTGQRGGLIFDERRSNIYKLFRATRCGPDSSVDPAEQVTFYDPGLGTVPVSHSFGIIGAITRSFYNLASQATGLGLTRNIVDCYSAILRLWRPGDRIFLFGFSRGAYTVRCLSAVLGMCGVPTQDGQGRPLRRDKGTTTRVASEAVRKVYQHTEPRKTFRTDRQRELSRQRIELARRFRVKYVAHEPHNESRANTYPYFIGVFDTVASLANPVAAVILFGVATVTLAIPSGLLAFRISHTWRSFWILFGAFAGIAIVTAVLCLAKSLIRSEFGLQRTKNWRPLHFTEVHMEQYETDLNVEVSYARHAISIDERRGAFKRVEWGGSESNKKTQEGWFVQRWFAGNHSDIGGSYPENESRLSDISLDWMLGAAALAGLKYDPSVLQLYPDPTGPQHDETRTSFVFSIARKLPRRIDNDAPLHPSVLARFEATEVLHYDTMKPYRPENLRSHDQVKHYYTE
jgi:uncharacterized protein (DUF2235 family)